MAGRTCNQKVLIGVLILGIGCCMAFIFWGIASAANTSTMEATAAGGGTGVALGLWFFTSPWAPECTRNYKPMETKDSIQDRLEFFALFLATVATFALSGAVGYQTGDV